MVFVTSLITPTLIQKLTVSGCFAFFGGFSFLSFFWIIFFVRDTSHVRKGEDGKKIIVNMTEKEKKELYWPEEFKNQKPK